MAYKIYNVYYMIVQSGIIIYYSLGIVFPIGSFNSLDYLRIEQYLQG